MSFLDRSNLFLGISVGFFVLIILAAIALTAVKAKLRGKKEVFKVLTPFRIFFVGVYLTLVLLLYPIILESFYKSSLSQGFRLKSAFISCYKALQPFILEGDIDLIAETLAGNVNITGGLSSLYIVFAAIMHFIAPIVTAGVVLFFFKEQTVRLRYWLSRRADIYILSELNEKSLALAKDITKDDASQKKKTTRKQIVFAEVFEDLEEKHFDLVAEAKRLGANCMRKSVLEIGLKPKSKKIKRKIYLISENQDDNVRHGLALIEKCVQTPELNNPQTEIFVFSGSMASESFLNSADNGNVKVRRINETRNLMLDTLRKHSVFSNAVQNGDIKEINIVIVGLGAYGTELLKALCWYTQMPGYRLKVHVFDKDQNGEKKISAIAPELIKYNGKELLGEAYYDIRFYDNVDVSSAAFKEEIAKIKNVTAAYVTLGRDELNIETAISLRIQFERNGVRGGVDAPKIYTIVYSTLKHQAFDSETMRSIEGDSYRIQFVDGINSRYSVKVIEQEALAEAALRCHMRWAKLGDEAGSRQDYDRYEYYRRASFSEAMYAERRAKLNIKRKEAGGVYDEALLKEYEHKRWNAYMRSEGYIKGEKKSHLAKTHPLLDAYQKLPPKEQEKDLITEFEDKEPSELTDCGD